MAERRMFSKRIINSARFLKMPVSTQALYFHLGLHADDDGVVEAYTVMNSVGSTEDDLKILVAKGFVIVLNEDLVSYITDWNENNKLRADRKVDSIYKHLLLQMNPDVQLIQAKPRADTKKLTGQPMDNQWTSNGPHSIGKDSIGKDSIGEISIVEDISSPAPAEQYLPYEEIINHLNERTGSNYKHTTKKTRDLIKARFNENFTLDDFKIVIDKKTAEWLNDKNMNKYLRPETLFGTKFESYLNQQVRNITTKDLAASMDFSEFK